ncbi:Uu.00g099210.m01.CDS01 [Anthostomella pinea]|uniref:Uu.00g099210.m01.CDS01 n=1 Tax=Anthostomella pinea TaxID=933095 RepID=A0AAI8VDF2_9PEZI|nr:Uu.00g099210.m01.CDS01 [Anthostomella pinea]
MASLGPPPADLDLTATRAPEMIGVLSTTWSLAIIAIGLRLWSRRLMRSRLWLDDWLILVSVLWSGSFMFMITCWMVRHGFGRHVWAAPPEATKVWAIGLFIAEITYTLSLVFVKYSILAFYWRVFGAQRSIRIPIWVLAGMVLAWGASVILVSIFQCLPVQAFWQRFDFVAPLPAEAYHCGVDDNDFFNGNAIPNIITDVMIMALPVPYIWKLYMPRAQKVAITSVFVVGIFVTIISIVRFTFVLRVDLTSPDITWNFVDTQMWTSLEGNVATVCACLPSLKPILNLLVYGSVESKPEPSNRAARGTLVTIGGSGESRKNRSRTAQGMRGSTSKHATETYSDEHPFAQLADDDSMTRGRATELQTL